MRFSLTQEPENPSDWWLRLTPELRIVLFERQYADLLGIAVEEGERQVFSTAAGRLLAFGHEVSGEVLGHQVVSFVYFFVDEAVEKNVLDRRGWLDRVRLGIVDYESTLYLSAPNEA